MQTVTIIENYTGSASNVEAGPSNSAQGEAQPTAQNQPDFVNEDFSHKQIQFIGHGCYATVWKTTFNNQDIAVKAYRAEADNAFVTELGVFDKVAHPNIIACLGLTHTLHTFHYGILLELADMTLTDYLYVAQNEDRDPKTCKKIGGDICKGLHFLHSRGFVHRDLKTDNILLIQSENDEITAKLSDFNISLTTNDFMGPEEIPWHLPPEDFPTRSHVKPSYDIPNLAFIIWLLTTAEKTEIFTTYACLMITLFRVDPRPYYPTVPETASPELQAFVYQALHAAPDRRPTSKAFVDVVTAPETVFRALKQKLA